MLLTFTSPNYFQNSYNAMTMKVKPCKRILFGKGQKLIEATQSQQLNIDLKNLDECISRVHAQLFFSPSWFGGSHRFLCKFFNKQLPEDLLYKIYMFLKPKPNCILRDLHSKTGIYRRVKEVAIEPNMIVGFGDNRIIEFISNQIIAHSQFEQIQQHHQGWQIKYTQQYKDLPWLSLLKLKCQKSFYALIGSEQSVYKIGRCSPCEIILNHKSISRKQALLKFNNSKWTLYDGNGQVQTINGTWLKQKQIIIIPQNNPNVKIGQIKIDIKLQNQLQETLSL